MKKETGMGHPLQLTLLFFNVHAAVSNLKIHSGIVLQLKKNFTYLNNARTKNDKQQMNSACTNIKYAFSMYFFQLSLDLPLPNWCSLEDYEKLKEITILTLDFLTETDLLKQVNAGPMVEEILENILKSEENNKIKMYLYAIHDINISAFLTAHNIKPGLIDYGSTIIVEKLRKKDNNVCIRVSIYK